jgi:predicted RND superfamily exporter protein
MDYQRVIDWTDDRIVNDSRKVILAFLAVTVLFATGLGAISTEAGTQQFTTGLPSEEALTEVNEKFSPSFSTDTGNTQLIQRGANVLDRPALVRMLRTQERLAAHDELRVSSTSSAAGIVARQIDPTATTPGEQRRTIEDATDGEIDRAVRRAAEESPQFTGLVSTDFNRGSASASVTLGLVTHDVPAGITEGAGQGGDSPLTPIQEQATFVVESSGQGSIEVFGSGVVADEFSRVIGDSLLIVVPAALLFIVFFLIIAYRDFADLLLGLFSLLMTIVWTFGFMGLAGIPFSAMLIAVPPLLLAVGIDFGIHAINRYREETERGEPPSTAMRTATDQLLVAFFIVTMTTTIGFLSNLSSALAPVRDFGIVASIGIFFTFLTFGVFVPAAKVELDRLREKYPIPTFSTTPLGAEGSSTGTALRGGVVLAARAPLVTLLLVLVLTGGVGVYATGVDTSFENEDFLPPEETPDFLEQLPEPFRPGEYTVTGQLNFLEENFESTQSSQATIYVEAPLERPSTLEEIHGAGEDPPDTFVRSDGRAESTSIVTVIQDQTAVDPQFRRVVDRNDIDDDGIPDQNLEAVYDALLRSDGRDRALQYMTEDRRNTRIVYTVEADAGDNEVAADAKVVADRLRSSGIATGQVVVFSAVADLILESALLSLGLSLLGTAIFLVLIYRLVEGAATLGIANLVPVLATVALLAGTMRYLGIPLNALTATILAITIGLGVDYSVHITHRYADERERHDLPTALDLTVRGTGGALLGSMLTTVSGIGVLSLALFPAIQQFGVLTGLSISYAFLTSVLLLPVTLAVWDVFVNGGSIRSLVDPRLEVEGDGPLGEHGTSFDDEWSLPADADSTPESP